MRFAIGATEFITVTSEADMIVCSAGPIRDPDGQRRKRFDNALARLDQRIERYLASTGSR